MAAAPTAVVEPVVELPGLVTFEKVAETYGFSLRSMREAANRDEFTHIHIGNNFYFRPGHLEAFLDLKTRKPKAPAASPRSRTRARVARERARRAA